MSKKQTEELATRPTAALATFDPSDTRGKEGIGAQERTLPRISIAQKTNKEIDPNTPDYIDGLKLYEMFNTVTGENYHKGPINVAFVAFRQFAILFDDANNVVEPNVPLNDPRLQFRRDPNGRPIRPEATLFYEYLAVLPETGEGVVITFKGAGIKTAKRRINSILSVTNGPLWARQFKLSSGQATSGQFTFGAFQVQPGDPTPADVAQMCSDLYDAWTSGQVQAARPQNDEPVVDDDSVPF